MDPFVDLVAVLSLPGVVVVVVGQGIIGAVLPGLLIVGFLDPHGVPGRSSRATEAGAEVPHGRTTTRSRS